MVEINSFEREGKVGMSNTEKDLSARYYVAEGSIWLLGGILVLSRFVGLAPDQALPILNITLEGSKHFVHDSRMEAVLTHNKEN